MAIDYFYLFYEHTVEQKQPEKIDFFISRTGADKDIAIHVNKILEEAGYTTLLQDEDFGPSDFMRKMEQGFENSSRMISILSKNYQNSEHCRSEYNHTLCHDPGNLKKRLFVFRIEDCKPVGSLQNLAYTDLVPVLHDHPKFKEVVLIAIGHKKQDIPSWFSALQRAPQQIIHPDIRPTPNFTGRKDELEQLETALWSDDQHIAAITQPAAVHGLGGVGKSILAKEYAWRKKELYTGLWWFNAETENGILDGLIDLGSKFIPGLLEEKNKTIAANHTMDFLETHYKDAEKPWLFIYDNIESEAIYRKFAPKGGAQVLLTSRESTFSTNVKTIPVDSWPLEEAIQYLRNESGRDLTDSEAEKIAKALGCMPLALSHTAAFLRENKARLPETYLKNIDTWLNKAPEHADYPAPVYATYQESIQICEQKAKGAKAIIDLASVLAPDNIPFEIYTQNQDLYPEELQQVVKDEESLTEILGTLDSLSLIRLDMTTKTFSLHRLVQAAALDDLKDSKQTYMNAAINALVEAYPGDDFNDWPAFERLLPHGQQVAIRSDNESKAPLPNLLNHIAWHLYERAAYEEAEPVHLRALKILQNSYGPEHLDVAQTLNNLAVLLKDTNRMAEAEPLYQQALKIMKNSLGTDHPDVAKTLSNLATLLKDTNRMAEAEPLYQQALKIMEGSLGTDHPGVAKILNNLASLLRDTNRMAEAEPLYRRALKIKEDSLGPDQPGVAHSLSGLASLLQDANRMDEAEPLYRRALKIFENSLGPDHPDVAYPLTNLANLLADTNRITEAEQLYRYALKILENSLGADHPDVAYLLTNFATLLADTKRITEAEQLYRRALKIREFSLPEGHPLIEQSHQNLQIFLDKKTKNNSTNFWSHWFRKT